MFIRDRIKELRRVRAAELRPNPRNWRTHPPAQADALRGVLAEVGYAEALVARELDDGTLELIDGHLRAEVTPEAIVPVLVLDVDEQEGLKLLATLDPLAALAEADAELLSRLVADVETESAALATMLAELVNDNPTDASHPDASPQELIIPRSYQVVVECDDEDQQRSVYERLRGEGFSCRLLSL